MFQDHEEEKKLLREEVLARLKAMLPAERARQIQEVRSLWLKWFPRGLRLIDRSKKTALYRSSILEFPVEVLCDTLERHSCVFPRVTVPSMGLMEFAQADPNNDSEWKKGAFQILEPIGSAVSDHDLTLILVPGVAFGKNLSRLGRGRGFYDRLFCRQNKAMRVALVFEQQLQDQIPETLGDGRVDALLSPSQVILTPRFKSWIANNPRLD